MSGDAQSSGAGGDAAAATATTTAPAGFSWSQVVRKDNQAGAGPGTAATGAFSAAPTPSPLKEKSESPPLGQAAGEVAEKVGKMKLFPAGGEASMDGGNKQAQAPPAAESDHKAASSAGEGVSQAQQQRQEAGAGQDGGSKEGDDMAAGSSQVVVDAPKPLKPAWVTAGSGAGAGGTKEGSSSGTESPLAVKVLSTSSQSWPTLGDAKTEPQKRGLSLEVQSNQNAGSNNSGSMGSAKHHGSRGELNTSSGRGSGYHGKRGGGSGGGSNNNNNNNREYTGNSANNSQRGNGGGNGGNPAGVSGNQGRRRQNGKNGGGHNNNAGGAPGHSRNSSRDGGTGGMNGWVGGGNSGGPNAGQGSRNYNNRSNRGGQNNQGGRGNNNRNNGGHHQAGGAKGRQQPMNGQMANGMGQAGGPMGQAPFYMPVYYAPMSAAGPGGAPVYMMPPPQGAMVNGGMAGPGGGIQGGHAGAGGPGGQGSAGKDSTILEAVKVQVEYYFSVQNLVKDMFLRAKMDEGGWIPIGVIAAFNRVRALAPNPATIAAALEGSALVEVSQSQESIRVRESWQQWVLPKERRDSSSSRPQSGPGSPVPGMGMHAHGISMASMYPCTEVSDDMLDRLTLIGRLATGDAVKDSEALVMTNDVAAMVNNGIAVLESQLRSQGSSQAGGQEAETAGAGGDTLPMVSNHFYPIAPMLAEQQPPRPKDQQQQQMPLVAPSTFGSHVGWMFAPSSSATAPAGQPESTQAQAQAEPADPAATDGDKGGEREKKKAAGEAVRHEAIHEFGHPAQSYFKANNYVQIKYRDFRDCCMQKRAGQAAQSPATTHTPEMYTLYQFWGLFLRDVFNASMYEEFKQCALRDHNEGHGSFGITCLFGLYHHRLLKEFRPVLFKDFENIAQQEFKKGNQQVMIEFNAFCISTGINSNSK